MAESFAGGRIDGGLIDPRADSGRGNREKRRRERKRSRLGTAEAESLCTLHIGIVPTVAARHATRYCVLRVYVVPRTNQESRTPPALGMEPERAAESRGAGNSCAREARHCLQARAERHTSTRRSGLSGLPSGPPSTRHGAAEAREEVGFGNAMTPSTQECYTVAQMLAHPGFLQQAGGRGGCSHCRCGHLDQWVGFLLSSPAVALNRRNPVRQLIVHHGTPRRWLGWLARPRLNSTWEALVNLKFQADAVVGGSLERAKFDLGSWNCPHCRSSLSLLFFLLDSLFAFLFLPLPSTAWTDPDSRSAVFYKKTV